MNRSLIPLACCIFAASCISGCHSDGPDVTTDIAYLRTPDIDAESSPAVSEPITLLFPTGIARRWQMGVTAMSKSYLESVRVTTPISDDHSTGDAVLTMYRDGKAYRTETYQVSADTLSIAASGSGDIMTMSPPMPILKTTAPEGAELKWTGTIQFKNSHAPAQAFSRVHEPEDLQTPAGKFHAYRVDTILSTIIEGHQVSFPASRWFAPGVGIVKQSFRVGRITVDKVLQSYGGE